MARVVSYSELDSLSIIDLANLNEALDLKLAAEGEIEILPLENE